MWVSFNVKLPTSFGTPESTCSASYHHNARFLNNFHHRIINTTFSSLLLLPERESTVLSKPHLTPTSQRMKAQNFHTCPRASLDANFLACVTIVTAGCTHSPVLPLKEWRQKLLRLWWLRFEVHHNFWNEDPLSFAERVLLYNGFV